MSTIKEHFYLNGAFNKRGCSIIAACHSYLHRLFIIHPATSLLLNNMLTLPSIHLSKWQSAAKGWIERPHQNVHPPHPPWMWMSTGMLFYVNKCHLHRTSVQGDIAALCGKITSTWLLSILDPLGLEASVVTAGSVSCWMSLIIQGGCFSTVLWKLSFEIQHILCRNLDQHFIFNAVPEQGTSSKTFACLWLWFLWHGGLITKTNRHHWRMGETVPRRGLKAG